MRQIIGGVEAGGMSVTVGGYGQRHWGSKYGESIKTVFIKDSFQNKI